MRCCLLVALPNLDIEDVNSVFLTTISVQRVSHHIPIFSTTMAELQFEVSSGDKYGVQTDSKVESVRWAKVWSICRQSCSKCYRHAMLIQMSQFHDDYEYIFYIATQETHYKC